MNTQKQNMAEDKKEFKDFIKETVEKMPTKLASRKVCFEAGYNKCKEDINKLINKQINRCKRYIKLNKKYLKLIEMKNNEWLKGRVEECEYTIDMLEELKSKINGEKENEDISKIKLKFNANDFED